MRWIRDGVLGHDGRRVRLEAARCAGRWLTTPQAIARFLAAQTPPTADSSSATPAPRTPTARSRAAARAARQLEAARI